MKRKALIFIEDGSYSYDNRVKRQARSLKEAGWEVSVISPKYKDDSFYQQTPEGIHSYHFPKPNAESALGHIAEHSISLALGSAFTAWAAVRRGFSVFHACNPMDTLWMIALPYKIVGKKFIFDQHDLCPELYLSRGEGGEKSFFYRTLLKLEKLSYQLADAVIATNGSYKKVALERGKKDEDNIFIVRNGPYLEKFVPGPGDTSLKKTDEILVGYLGNMNKQDGVDLILETAQEIVENRNITHIKFILIGGGSSQRDLVQQAKSMGLEEHVSFTGRIPDRQMLDTLNACDICVQPDPLNPLNDRSTMNKVMEYMALEKPVIAFDLTETRVSCGEDAAIYAKPNEVSDLAEQVVQLARDPERRKKMGKLGRKRVEEKLAWQYSAEHLRQAYEYALKN